MPSTDLTEYKADLDRGSRLHQLREELGELKATAFQAYFRLAEIMKEIRDDELWREGYESFTAFCASEDIGFTFSHVKNAIVTLERFPDYKQLSDIAYSKLQDIGPYLTAKNREDLIEKARSLSRSDLKHELNEMGLSQREDPGWYLPKIWNCEVCGKVRGVRFEGLCHCGWTPKQIEYVSKIIDKVDAQEYEI